MDKCCSLVIDTEVSLLVRRDRFWLLLRFSWNFYTLPYGINKENSHILRTRKLNSQIDNTTHPCTPSLEKVDRPLTSGPRVVTSLYNRWRFPERGEENYPGISFVNIDVMVTVTLAWWQYFWLQQRFYVARRGSTCFSLFSQSRNSVIHCFNGVGAKEVCDRNLKNACIRTLFVVRDNKKMLQIIKKGFLIIWGFWTFYFIVLHILFIKWQNICLQKLGHKRKIYPLPSSIPDVKFLSSPIKKDFFLVFIC